MPAFHTVRGRRVDELEPPVPGSFGSNEVRPRERSRHWLIFVILVGVGVLSYAIGIVVGVMIVGPCG